MAISFEQEMKSFLINGKYDFVDNSAEFKLLDFTINNFITELQSNGNSKNIKLYLEHAIIFM